jgi:hypothetical protein
MTPYSPELNPLYLYDMIQTKTTRQLLHRYQTKIKLTVDLDSNRRRRLLTALIFSRSKLYKLCALRYRNVLNNFQTITLILEASGEILNSDTSLFRVQCLQTLQNLTP